MADSKRRSFPEFAKLLSKEPGWADEESALQEILGAFLRGQLSDVTCPRADVGVGEHGVLQTRVAIPGPDPNPAVLPYPMYIPDRLIEIETPLRHKSVPTLSPPQQPFTRDDWKEGFRAFGGQGQNAEVIGFEVLADIPISAFPPEFRQAYIDWLYTTDDAAARWLKETGRSVPGWLKVHQEDEQPKAPAKGHRRPGRPTFAPEIEEAYRDLKGEGQVDLSLPKTVLYPAIRERICNRDDVTITTDVEGRPRGLGNEAIRLVVTPLFEADLTKARHQHTEESSRGPHKL